MSWKQISDQFTINDIGARLLANLARGIYSHEAVLREYVQNACDAYKELSILPDYPTINIMVVSEDTITIQDNGVGMDEQRM
jgi:HSP90 family molecular chaperone